MPTVPQIPETITVHLGAPDTPALNVTLPYEDYLANVGSSEIYPTWPESALRANLYAQSSFALNRIYTEYYRSRGYDFDITNSTAYDQAFVNGRDVFRNIRDLVSDLFNNYIRRQGQIEPLFAQYCNGTTVTCSGLSQWGTVDLANRGYTPYQILTYYYGPDIELVTDAPVAGPSPSAPAVPLRLGAVGDDVRTIQLRLNRISANYPSIPKIVRPDGIFTYDTEAAVRRFQEVFGLTADGVIGRNTWYAIQRIYNAVKRLNELDSEGITLEEVSKQYPNLLRPGSTGLGVSSLQYYIRYLSQFYDTIESVTVDGVYGPETERAVRNVQYTFGLPVDGVVGENTWNTLYNAYRGIVRTIPLEYREGVTVPFPGVILRLGSEAPEVRLLQEYLNVIARSYPSVPTVNPTGYFGTRTQEAVTAFQRLFGYPTNGIVGATVWNAITDLYSDLTVGTRLNDGQYPGSPVGAS